ncbi:MAG: S8 family serine peptidase, partial [Candidatus Eiseniibacteriota bacterium]
TAGRARVEALGVAAVDRLSGRLGGVWFEPLFPGETPPPSGSDEPDFTSFYVAHLPPGVALAEALDRFGALAEVVSADPIAILPVNAFPNDSLWTASPWFYQPGTRRDIHAPEAWDVTTGDTSVVVAVLDTGVLPYHPDLGGGVAGLPGQIWTNWVEAAGIAGVDDDGNGYVDDVHGWDFVTQAPDGLPGEDANIEDNDPKDFVGHGTAVAGLVGALTDNGIGVAGTAWRVRIMPVRMGWGSTFSPGGEVQMNFAARAVRYATRMRATVINCSWASVNSDGIDAAVTAAVRAGITVVSAAGNSAQPHYLADRDDVLAVAATDANDALAPFSNRGAYVDLTAPGVDIRSTWSAQYQPAYSAPLDGTSFSAPLVSGAAALIQSRHVPPYAPRLLTSRGVQLRLMEAADDIAAQNPFAAGQYGAGRLNAHRALTQVTGSTATRTGARSVGSSVLLASDGNPHVAYLTSNRRLVRLDAVTQDTVMFMSTLGAPNGSLAAALLGCETGTALFYSTLEEGVNGLGADGTPLAGTWPQPASAPAAMSPPALGDLDGDGIIEVVSGGEDGQLWAWHTDGSPVAGYPVATGIAPLGAAPTLSDLDGVPGVEVVIAAADGTVHAFGAGGTPLGGWPVTVGANPRAPVIGRIGSGSPSVVVAAGNQLHALSTAGLPRAGFPVTLAGSAAQDPALADLDGDGNDEIIVATASSLEVRDSSGAALSALGWPRPLSAPPQGPPVLGELSTLSPGPELLIQRGGSLLALERDGDSIRTFPKLGGAGVFPSLGQADADPAAEVVAGTGSDSLFNIYYVYDAGQGSSAAGEFPWPTARGNFARTGSRLYAPPAVTLSPCRVSDLRVVVRTDSSVSLAWTATGDDGSIGRPERYAVRAALTPLDEATFASAPVRRLKAATVDAGGAEYLVVVGLVAATRYWVGLKAVDERGNASPISNVVEVQTGVGGPLGSRAGIVLDVAPRPSRGKVEFFWQASGDGEGSRQTIHVFDVGGRRLRVLEVGTALGGRATWDGRDAEGRSVPAGLYYARLFSGSIHTQTRLVLLP